MEVSYHFLALAILLLGKELLVTIGQEAGWTPENVQKLFRKK
jgi:hypothetical protein